MGSRSGWCCARGVAGFGQGFLDSRVNTNVYNAVMAIAGQVSLVNHALAGCIIPSVWLHIREANRGLFRAGSEYMIHTGKLSIHRKISGCLPQPRTDSAKLILLLQS